MDKKSEREEKVWVKPEIVVIARSGAGQENILSGCKSRVFKRSRGIL